MDFKFYAVTYKKDFTTTYFAIPNSLYYYLKETNNEEFIYDISLRYSIKDKEWHTDNFKIKDKENYLFKEIIEETETLRIIKDKLKNQLCRHYSKPFYNIYNLFAKEIRKDYTEIPLLLFKDDSNKLCIPLYISDEHSKTYAVLKIIGKNDVFTKHCSEKNSEVIPLYEIIFSDEYKNRIKEMKEILRNDIIPYLLKKTKENPIKKENFFTIFVGYLRCKKIIESIEKAGC